MSAVSRVRGADRGFTLIELLVVVVILGVLIAIAIPIYLSYRKGATDRGAQADLRNAISVLERCNADNIGYPTASSLAFASNSASPCTGQTINKSAGTTFNYVGDKGGFALQTFASNGNTSASSYYCYTSQKGGSVVQSTKTFPSSCDSTFTC